MACTIDATVGGAAANSYCTIAEANSYNESHVSGATWAAATDDAKCQALQTATRLLNSYVEWVGSPTTTTQALPWPRLYAPWVAGCGAPENSLYVSSTIIPSQLKMATSEYARLLLVNDPTLPSSSDTSGLQSIKASEIQLVFRSPAEASSSPGKSVVPGSVIAYVDQWMTSVMGGVTRPLVRV